MSQKITPYFWFDHQAEEAANYYVSLFNNASILSVSRYGEQTPGTPGSVMIVSIQIQGQEFIFLNGGPIYQLTPAVSFYVDCEDQAEVDRLWDSLSTGGTIMDCGWVTDRYGVTWQIVPRALGELMQNGDPQVVGRVTQAMLKMKKLIVADLVRAAEQG